MVNLNNRNRQLQERVDKLTVDIEQLQHELSICKQSSEIVRKKKTK